MDHILFSCVFMLKDMHSDVPILKESLCVGTLIVGIAESQHRQEYNGKEKHSQYKACALAETLSQSYIHHYRCDNIKNRNEHQQELQAVAVIDLEYYIRAVKRYYTSPARFTCLCEYLPHASYYKYTYDQVEYY